MPTVQEILQFNFNSTSFSQKGKSIISNNLIRDREDQIAKLKKIEEVLGLNPLPKSSPMLISNVFLKFKSSLKNKNVQFDRREIMALSYALNYSNSGNSAIFKDKQELEYVFNLMNSSWRDSYLFGLLDCLLSNWSEIKFDSLKLLSNYIFEKFNEYNGSRKTLLSLKKCINYFNIQNGDLVLGDTLARKEISLRDITKYLDIPETWITYSYFTNVIYTYYEKRKSKIINEIDLYIDILDKHNNIYTTKKLISKIIYQIQTERIVNIQERIKIYAFLKIGDPSHPQSWTYSDNVSETIKKDLIKARDILNEWLTKQFIDIFFRTCIDDKRRREFWLNYSSYITTFTVYGSIQTKNVLKNNESIAKYVDSRFQTVRSNNSISAIIMYIGNYMLIEFSNLGYSFYAYKLSSIYKPDLNDTIRSVDDLRNGSLQKAIRSDKYRDYYEDEGRLFHIDGKEKWEPKFQRWLRNKVIR